MPAQERTRKEDGFTILETVIAAAILGATSISLILSISSSSMASKGAEQSVQVQESLESVRTVLDDVPGNNLLSWDGSVVDRGNHEVLVEVSLSSARLLAIEMTAVDKRSNTVRGRVATYRCISQ